ncbi:MAG: helix-turn-helix domain-containing protein, partial [Bdellovibrionia bacterium]
LVQFDLGTDGKAEHLRFTNEFGLAMLYRRLNDFAGTRLALKKVHFRHELNGEIAEYEKFFGTTVLFGKTDNSLFFDKKIKKTPCKNSDSFLLGTMLNLAEKIFSKLPGKAVQSDFVARVRESVRRSFHDGEPTARKIAKELALSTRTLQRMLEAEGTSLTEVTIAERKILSNELLKSPDLTNEDVALMLGYSTLSAFNKAFKQWFKMTPSEFRKTVSSGR